ncbi:MAG: divalent-cation tolerance protein CutA [bacterium]
MNFCVILTLTPNFEEARKIARSLVENNLAACVNIVQNVTSVYRWKEEIQEDSEFLLFIKTQKTLFDKVKQSIRDLHSYELPEIIMLPIENGQKNFLSWIEQETRHDTK